MKTIEISSNSLIGTIAVTALVALTAPTFARGGGVGAGGMSSSYIGSQGSLNTNGPSAADRDFGRDRAEDRANANADLSTTTRLHTNGPASLDRDHGDDRAQDRMSKDGAMHSRAHINGSTATETEQ